MAATPRTSNRKPRPKPAAPAQTAPQPHEQTETELIAEAEQYGLSAHTKGLALVAAQAAFFEQVPQRALAVFVERGYRRGQIQQRLDYLRHYAALMNEHMLARILDDVNRIAKEYGFDE